MTDHTHTPNPAKDEKKVTEDKKKTKEQPDKSTKDSWVGDSEKK